MKTKIGVYGIDHNHCEAKVSELCSSEDFEVVVVYCESQAVYDKRVKNSKTYKNLNIVFDKEEFFKVKGLDIVLVEPAVPNLLDFAEEIVGRGYNIHLDKTVGPDLARWKKILDMAKRNGTVIQTGYMYRYNAGVQYIFEKIKEGEIGNVFHIEADMSTGLPADFKKALINYGVKSPVMFIYGVHLIDLIIKIMGEPKSIKAFNASSGSDGLDFEDNALVVLEYERGLATVRTCACEVDGWETRIFKVCGEQGTIRVSPIENKMSVLECYKKTQTKNWASSGNFVDIQENKQRYLKQFRDLVKIINHEEENPYSYEHEYIVQKVLLKACGYDIKD